MYLITRHTNRQSLNAEEYPPRRAIRATGHRFFFRWRMLVRRMRWWSSCCKVLRKKFLFLLPCQTILPKSCALGPTAECGESRSHGETMTRKAEWSHPEEKSVETPCIGKPPFHSPIHLSHPMRKKNGFNRSIAMTCIVRRHPYERRVPPTVSPPPQRRRFPSPVQPILRGLLVNAHQNLMENTNGKRCMRGIFPGDGCLIAPLRVPVRCWWR